LNAFDVCRCVTERNLNADKSYLGEGIALLDLARNAQRLFAKQAPREKRHLLNFLLSNRTWEDGKVVATFRQPFDMLAEMVIETRNERVGGAASAPVLDKWLPELDSNQRHFD
jgi:site-specific DNA recombinase